MDRSDQKTPQRPRTDPLPKKRKLRPIIDGYDRIEAASIDSVPASGTLSLRRRPGMS